MTLRSDIPTVLFSVETASREFDSKLVTASVLAARGCRVIVGHKEAAREIAEQSRNVVWQGKSLFSVHSEEHLADRILENGSAIMFMTDEGAMHQADSWVDQTLHKHWVDHFRTRRLGRMCVWGARQRDVIQECAPELRDTIAVTGSVRFDLCRPDYAWITEDGSHSTLGGRDSYVLVLTRFGAVAHARGMGAPFQIKLNPNAWPDQIEWSQVRDLWFRKWRQDVHDFGEFVVLIKELASAHPERSFVIRPHPSESLEFYESAFATLGNVEIVRVGNVLTWIRGAAIVLHSNSTSGLEAVLAGRATVNFLPSAADRTGLDVEVAREAGTTVGCLPEALERVQGLLAGEPFAHQWSPHAKSMLHNLVEDALPRLTEATLAVIEEAGLDASHVVLPREPTLQDVVGRVLRGQLRRPPELDPYVTAKRGTIDPAHVEQVVDGCRSRGIGGGRVVHSTAHYVVVEPS